MAVYCKPQAVNSVAKELGLYTNGAKDTPDEQKYFLRTAWLVI